MPGRAEGEGQAPPHPAEPPALQVSADGRTWQRSTLMRRCRVRSTCAWRWCRGRGAAGCCAALCWRPGEAGREGRGRGAEGPTQEDGTRLLGEGLMF